MVQIPVAANDRVFVLTGAGISAESGLPTFRAEDGLWAGHRVEDVCTPEAWSRNPALVWEFYSKRRAAAQNAQPNPAHFALSALEVALADRFFLCTQNVDDLHERAGSERLLHMHGELAKSRCEWECGRSPIEDHAIYASLDEVGHCLCGGRLRPHIVFFGETPLEMDRIQQEIANATLMLVVGTSGSVYPAANFVHWARRTGARTVYVGPEPPLNASAFTHVVEGKAGEVLPLLFQLSEARRSSVTLLRRRYKMPAPLQIDWLATRARAKRGIDVVDVVRQFRVEKAIGLPFVFARPLTGSLRSIPFPCRDST